MQAVGILLVLVGTDFAAWALAMGLLGLGTALVYPTLLAAISDVAHPEWRASAVGVYQSSAKRTHVGARGVSCSLAPIGHPQNNPSAVARRSHSGNPLYRLAFS